MPRQWKISNIKKNSLLILKRTYIDQIIAFFILSKLTEGIFDVVLKVIELQTNIDFISFVDLLDAGEIIDMGFKSILINIVLMFSIYFIIKTVVGGPLEVGYSHFLTNVLKDEKDISDIVYGFENNALKNMRLSVYRYGIIILKCLLLIVPGLIAYFDYLFAGFIAADYPNLSNKEILNLSKKMMKGNKWKYFLVLLSLFILGILSNFVGIIAYAFLGPYMHLIIANIYKETKENMEGMV